MQPVQRQPAPGLPRAPLPGAPGKAVWGTRFAALNLLDTGGLVSPVYGMPAQGIQLLRGGCTERGWGPRGPLAAQSGVTPQRMSVFL